MFLGVWCILVTLVCVRSTNITVGDVLHYLELYKNMCFDTHLCFLRPDKSILYSTTQMCCPPCGCDDDCVDSQTCCPDFWLDDVLPSGKVYTSLELLRKDLVHVENKTLVGIYDVPVKVPTHKEYVSCITPNGTQIMKHDREGLFTRAIEVISECPKVYRNQTIFAKETNDRCNRLLVNSKVEADFDFNIFLPVISLTSNITYKNIYCLRCHEENAAHIKFAVCIESERNDIWETSLSNSRHALKQIFSNPENITYRLNMQPPGDYKEHVNFCGKHINSCPKTSSLYTDRDDRLCRGLFFPFTLPYGTEVRNLACLSCRSDSIFMYDCGAMAMDGWFKYRIEILIDSDTIFQSPKHLLRVTTETAKRDLGERRGTSAREHICKKGYTFDKYTKRCRKLACPTMMSEVEEQCVPFYGNLENISFSVKLQIALTSIKESFNMNFIRRIFTTSKTIASAMFTKSLCLLERSHEEGETDQKYTYYIKIFFELASGESTYKQGVLSIRKYLELINNQTVRFNRKIHKIKLNPLYRDKHTIPVELDKKISNSFLVTDLKYHYRKHSKFTKTKIELWKHSFCQRLYFDLSEVTFTGNFTFTVGHSVDMIVTETIQLENTTLILACVDNYISETNLDTGNQKKPTSTSSRREKTRRMYVQASSLFSGCCIAIIVFAAVARSRKHRDHV